MEEQPIPQELARAKFLEEQAWARIDSLEPTLEGMLDRAPSSFNDYEALVMQRTLEIILGLRCLRSAFDAYDEVSGMDILRHNDTNKVRE